MRRWILALAGAAALTCPSGAAAVEPLVDRAPTASTVPDRVFTHTATSRPRARAAASRYRAYRTQDGNTVRISLARAYAGRTKVARSFADFLGSLPHGSELSRLRVHIAPPAQASDLCGGGNVVACYTTRGNLMIVPGKDPPRRTGLTASYVVAHEYGHHVAAFRSHAPFEAIEYGPKRWSSHERVCDGVLDGRYTPGDQAAGYRTNPGEAWAETYAQLKYPDARWGYVGSLEPGRAALAAARRDVLEPWRMQRARTETGTLDEATTTQTFSFDLKLDGALSFTLRGPQDADFDLDIAADGETLERTTTAGAQDRVAYPGVCRTKARERVTVTVRRRSGDGPFTLDLRWPG